jgi:hypothetical protein
MVVEWVDAIEQHEHELLKREAYNTSVSVLVPKRPALGLTRSCTAYDVNNTHMPSKNTTCTANTACTGISDGMKLPINNGTTPKITATPQTSEHGILMGPPIPVKQKIPLTKIMCHACGQRGHYKGLRECPKIPSSACLHIMGTDGEIEDLTSTENVEASNKLVNSKEYEGEDDFRPAKAEPELDDVGTGVIIASIHVDEEHDDDDTVIYAAAMAVSNKINPDDDITVIKALMKSVKEDYETWGSALKP